MYKSHTQKDQIHVRTLGCLVRLTKEHGRSTILKLILFKNALVFEKYPLQNNIIIIKKNTNWML